MKTWLMQCSAGDWQSEPFEIDEGDEFEAASESMVRHVIGAHDGAPSAQVVMRRTADLSCRCDHLETDHDGPNGVCTAWGEINDLAAWCCECPGYVKADP